MTLVGSRADDDVKRRRRSVKARVCGRTACSESDTKNLGYLPVVV